MVTMEFTMIAQNSLVSLRRTFGLMFLAAALCGGSAPAQALDVTAGLSQALNTQNFKPLFARSHDAGFTLGSSFFSGRGSGYNPQAERGVNGLGVLGQGRDRFAELEGDQRVFALLIDGKYDFAYDFGTGLALHPYVGGGVGVALYEANPTNAALSQDGAMVPLFRIGGGVVFKMGADWDLSLNYKAGYTGGLAGSSVFTGRSQEKVDLQSLDMGVKFRF
jgi:opacity protein-like surface antigen